MDSNGLRIIANPYLLKKEVKKNKNNKLIEIDNDQVLFTYLSKKYQDVYIHPHLFYQIKEKINESMAEHIIRSVLHEMVDFVSNKFDIAQKNLIIK